MTYDPQGPERGVPQDPMQGSTEGPQGSQPGSYQASEQSRGYRMGDEPRTASRKSGGKRTILIGGGLLALVALAGIIAGVAASNNPAPRTAAIRHVPVAPASHLVGTFDSVGPGNSAGFVMPTSSATAHYTYTCAAGAAPAAFRAGLLNATGTDTEVIATTMGTKGSGTVALHPKYPGTTYHIAADSTCPYRIQVYSK
jgi:hypothetical protein